MPNLDHMVVVAGSDHENDESQNSTQTVDETLSTKAIPQSKTTELEWGDLQKQSLKPGGFGDKRAEIWPGLLGVGDALKPVAQRTQATDDPCTPISGKTQLESRGIEYEHPDERQIKLDTDRSFVLYPVDMKDKRDTLQENLRELLVELFRKRKHLGYFQGYHDIITVIYLTVPSAARFACAEKMSLHRVRDSMGPGLEPVLGLLRVTKNLLRLADREFSEILERTSPLPFYALSNLLTLFSHDMPTLPLIQHVFDYLLCRPPIAVVYLATVIILSRKDEVLVLEDEGEEGMAHSLLSSLPDIVDDDEEDMKESSTNDILRGLGNSQLSEFETKQGIPESPEVVNPLPRLQETTSPGIGDGALISGTSQHSDSQTSAQSRARSRSTRSLSNRPIISDSPIPSLPHTSRSPSRTKCPSPPPLTHIERLHADKPKVSLVSLLTWADELRGTFAPDHPELRVAKIMGPQSVIFTWAQPRPGTSAPADGESEVEDIRDLDDAAETMLLHPELIVYPYDPGSDDRDEGHPKEGHGESGSQDTGRKEKRKRRKLQKSRHLDGRTRTIVTGAVIVLGVAMAVYGIHTQKTGNPSSFLPPFASTHAQKKWAQGQQWFSGAIAGATMKLVHVFAAGDDERGDL